MAPAMKRRCRTMLTSIVRRSNGSLSSGSAAGISSSSLTNRPLCLRCHLQRPVTLQQLGDQQVLFGLFNGKEPKQYTVHDGARYREDYSGKQTGWRVPVLES